MAAQRRDIPVAERQAHVHVPLRIGPTRLEVDLREPLEDDPSLPLPGRDARQATIHHERVEHLLPVRVTRRGRSSFGHLAAWSGLGEGPSSARTHPNGRAASPPT
jgi:hypothetical protein